MKNFALIALALGGALSGAGASEYLVLVSKTSAEDPAWKNVGDQLAASHSGTCEIWDGSAPGLTAALKKSQPRYLAIVAKPEKFTASMVRAINRATRMADDDPWTDCRWGLITGNTAAEALHLAAPAEPLIIHRALCTTGINLGLVDSGLVLSDGGKGGLTRKAAGGKPADGKWDEAADPAGTVGLFANAWNNDDPQLLVTSSHATQFNLEMPFGLGLIVSHGGKFHVLSQEQRNTFAGFLGGAMFKGELSKLGEWIDTTNAPTLKPSTGPKVWLGAGNCLLGDAKGTGESMVVTALGAGGCKQLVGYVVPTWFGRGGWGTSSLWQDSRGRLSLSEAFYLNQQMLIDETITRFPGAMNVVFNSDDIEHGMKQDRAFIEGINGLAKDGNINMEKDGKDVMGLIHDRDVVAFWGDPAWEARFDPKRMPHALTPAWSDTATGLKLTLTASENFTGGFPIWLPKRLNAPTLKHGNADLDAMVADDFLVLRKFTLKKGEKLEIELVSKAG